MSAAALEVAHEVRSILDELERLAATAQAVLRHRNLSAATASAG